METFQGSLESESIQGATHRNLICSSSGFSDRSYFANEEHGNRIYVRSHDSQCEESDRSQEWAFLSCDFYRGGNVSGHITILIGV